MMITYVDFRPLITKVSEIRPLSVVTADKGYDSEDNHVLVREELDVLSVIPARYEHVPIRKTHGRYRKQMKRGYSQLLYNQHNKDEIIFSDKTTIWRANYIIKIGKNTEQRTVS
jgi:hypothetical protein